MLVDIDDEILQLRLIQQFGLTEEEAENCLYISLPAGYGSMSAKAINKILCKLEHQGLSVTEAVIEAGLSDAKQAETVITKIKKTCPEFGNVKILRITDKQFSEIIHLGKHERNELSSPQLALF